MDTLAIYEGRQPGESVDQLAWRWIMGFGEGREQIRELGLWSSGDGTG